MEYTDLIDRLIPDPLNTLIVNTPSGRMILVDTSREPREGQTVLDADDRFAKYKTGMQTIGVAYCAVKFL